MPSLQQNNKHLPIASGSDNNDNDVGGVVEGSAMGNHEIVVITPRCFWLISVSLYVGLFLSMMDSSVVAASLPSIANDFNNFANINWVALAYTLANLSTVIVFARISDIIGRCDAYLVAQILFFASSLACGFSQNLPQLVAFRAVQGIGGAGLFSLAMIIPTDICPEEILQLAISLTGITIIAAAVTGPVVGGTLTQHASWRWVFWINGPICFVFTLFFLLCWPRAADLTVTARRSWKAFDYVGSAVLVSAAVLVVFAFQNVSTSVLGVWDHASFIAPLVVGSVCWVGVFAWGHRIESRAAGIIMPTFPISLFRSRVYAAGTLCTLLLGFPLFLLVFLIPLRAQIVSSKGPLAASVMLLPMLGATSVATIVSAAINSKKNYLCECMFVGASFSTLGCALLTTVSDARNDRQLLGYLAVVGFGIGLSTASATLAVTVEVPAKDYAPAHGIVAQVRLLGGSLGISASAVFIHNAISNVISMSLAPTVLRMRAEEDAKIPSYLRNHAQQICSQAFHNSMILSAGISGMAVLSALVGYQRIRSDMKSLRRVHRPDGGFTPR